MRTEFGLLIEQLEARIRELAEAPEVVIRWLAGEDVAGGRAEARSYINFLRRKLSEASYGKSTASTTSVNST